jgi:TRAP-type C4-dicarboxylate transport system substrate-binding protein
MTKNSKKFSAALLVMIAFAIQLVIGFAAEASAASEKITLKFAIYNPPTHPMALAMVRYLDDVPKMTNGRLAIKPYLSGTLFPPKESLDGIQRKIADIALTTCEYHTGTLPLWDLHHVPGVFKDARGANTSYDGGLMALWQKALDKKGFDKVKVVAMAFNSFGYLASNKKLIKTPPDFNGLKIKVSGASATELVKSCGGSTVAMSSSGVYEALQRGILDGILTTAMALESYKWTEVLDYFTNYPLLGYSAAILVNKKSLEELPSDLQAVVLEVLDHSNERLRCEFIHGNQGSFSRLPEQFKEVYTPTREEEKAWKEAAKPIKDFWLSRVDDKELAYKMLELAAKYNP